MAEQNSIKPQRINPTTPERQVAAFGVELDKLIYRFTCEFDIAPEDYAAALMVAAEDVLHEVDEDTGFLVRMIDGPLAGELFELSYPSGYKDERVLFWETAPQAGQAGAVYRLLRLPTGMWQGYELRLNSKKT